MGNSPSASGSKWTDDAPESNACGKPPAIVAAAAAGAAAAGAAASRALVAVAAAGAAAGAAATAAASRVDGSGTKGMPRVRSASSLNAPRSDNWGLPRHYEPGRLLGRGATCDVWLFRDTSCVSGGGKGDKSGEGKGVASLEQGNGGREGCSDGQGRGSSCSGDDGRLVAMKLLRRPVPEALLPNVLRELTLHSSLLHPHIAQVYGVHLTPRAVGIELEPLQGGTLLTDVQGRWRQQGAPSSSSSSSGLYMGEAEAAAVFRQIVSAIAYCHRRGVAHRDVKLENVLLFKAGDSAGAAAAGTAAAADDDDAGSSEGAAVAQLPAKAQALAEVIPAQRPAAVGACGEQGAAPAAAGFRRETGRGRPQQEGEGAALEAALGEEEQGAGVGGHQGSSQAAALEQRGGPRAQPQAEPQAEPQQEVLKRHAVGAIAAKEEAVEGGEAAAPTRPGKEEGNGAGTAAAMVDSKEQRQGQQQEAAENKGPSPPGAVGHHARPPLMPALPFSAGIAAAAAPAEASIGAQHRRRHHGSGNGALATEPLPSSSSGPAAEGVVAAAAGAGALEAVAASAAAPAPAAAAAALAGAPVIKLADFGAATLCNERPGGDEFFGTPPYMAPQLLHDPEGRGHDAAAGDVWAAGVLLCAMLFGRFPFDHARRRDPATAEARLEIWCSQNLRPWSDLPELQTPLKHLSAGCRDLLDQVLQVDEHARPTAQQLLRHPWLSDPVPAGPAEGARTSAGGAVAAPCGGGEGSGADGAVADRCEGKDIDGGGEVVAAPCKGDGGGAGDAVAAPCGGDGGDAGGADADRVSTGKRGMDDDKTRRCCKGEQRCEGGTQQQQRGDSSGCHCSGCGGGSGGVADGCGGGGGGGAGLYDPGLASKVERLLRFAAHPAGEEEDDHDMYIPLGQQHNHHHHQAEQQQQGQQHPACCCCCSNGEQPALTQAVVASADHQPPAAPTDPPPPPAQDPTEDPAHAPLAKPDGDGSSSTPPAAEDPDPPPPAGQHDSSSTCCDPAPDQPHLRSSIKPSSSSSSLGLAARLSF